LIRDFLADGGTGPIVLHAKDGRILAAKIERWRGRQKVATLCWTATCGLDGEGAPGVE
jgi:hypothetical protein